MIFFWAFVYCTLHLKISSEAIGSLLGNPGEPGKWVLKWYIGMCWKFRNGAIAWFAVITAMILMHLFHIWPIDFCLNKSDILLELFALDCMSAVC